jgi:predicted ArsR family transcriptional regulator
MGPSKSSAATLSANLHESPGHTHERILRVLGITQRPLKSGELANALGLISQEANGACKWLTDQGFITRMVKADAQRAAMAEWSLAEKGRAWVKGQS